MGSTDEDNVLLYRSHGAMLLKSEVEVESVVESVVRGEIETNKSVDNTKIDMKRWTRVGLLCPILVVFSEKNPLTVWMTRTVRVA